MITPSTISSTAPVLTSLESSKLTFLRTLKRGVRGDDVKYLQQILIIYKLLPAGADTGFFGTATEAALKKFQRGFGLESTGIVGLQTRNILNTLK